MTANWLLEVSAEVAEALAGHKPIVALESTIITHGMPYPKNLETALMLERRCARAARRRRRSR